jgi:hypothetical protein
METLEIVFGHSCYYTMKKSNLNNNILIFNTIFNVGDLSNIKNYKIKIPDELYFEEKNVNFKNEYNIIVDNIKSKNKIRVWTGREDIYSYLIMLYVCSIIKKYNYELYVLYCDEYNKDYPSPRVMDEKELESLTRLEHKLTNKEIEENVKTWNELVNKNSDLRIINNDCVKSVSFDFYDDYILKKLKSIGKIKISKLVGIIMQDIYLIDNMIIYLINRLIKSKKIKITLVNNDKYPENLIEINDEEV